MSSLRTELREPIPLWDTEANNRGSAKRAQDIV